MRARRLASVAVLAVLGVVALSGCRNDPAVAAYVGNHRYSQSEVDSVISEIKDKIPPGQTTAVRNQVVQMLVVRDVAGRFAREHNITVPPVDAVGYAQQRGLPSGTRYTDLAAGFESTLTAIQKAAPSVAPSEADQREAHSHLTVQGKAITDSFDTVKPYLGEDQLGKAVGFRNEMRDAVKQADVTVNPRYTNLGFQVPAQVGQAATWLGVSLGQRDGTVTDLAPTAEPSASAQ